MNISDRVCWFISVFVMSVLGMTAISPRQQATPQPPVGPPPLVQPQQPLPPILPPTQPSDPELQGLHVPIPKEIRLYNKSGSQCVWCTIEMLGTYHGSAGVKGLTQKYKHATGPGEVNRVLTQRNVKFKQVTGRDLDFIEEWVTNKRMGVGIGVNHNHVILVCHFERNKLVKVIDNSDRSLRVQTWDWAKFTQRFSGWVFVILPDHAQVETGWNNDVDDGLLYHAFATNGVSGADFTYNGVSRRFQHHDLNSRSPAPAVYHRQAASQVRKADERDAP